MEAKRKWDGMFKAVKKKALSTTNSIPIKTILQK